mmetsp:Transcript_13764/g.38043  ORF Transcript_13764/g.38043 Transcript_13764/m.38043 type:complete len:91 (+) Transcript_13764:426-698(+)
MEPFNPTSRTANTAGVVATAPKPVVARSRGGIAHNDKAIQQHHIRAMFDEFGDDIWEYADHGGHPTHLKGKFQAAHRAACDLYNVPESIV